MNDLYLIDINGIEEEIRCAICKNQIKTDKGCDGNCKYDESLFRKITTMLDGRIELLPFNQPHWIPVTERLPDNSRNVLITHKGGVSMGWYNGLYFEKGASTHHRKMKTVVAWMELPSAYRGEKNDNI